jgi:C-terminal processing protease CtpA/Prc
VQEYEELPDGSALKLTVALWFTPKDRSIDESGIQPDIVVEEKKEVKSEKDEPESYVNRRDPLKDEFVQRALQFFRTGK